MASYTMQLKTYIEQATQYEEGLSNMDRIKEGRKKLFDFDYPFFDDNYREQFEVNFISNFYTREIGFETEGLFKFKLESWLNINMPYYNEMFETTKIKYDPLLNARMTTERERTTDSNRDDKRLIDQVSNSESQTNEDMTGKSNKDVDNTVDNFSRQVSSDTPDNRLALTTRRGTGVIEYASGIDEEKQDNRSQSNTQSDSESNSKSNASVEGTTNQTDDYNRKQEELEKYREEREGKIGTESYSKMLREYRQELLRVEVDIHRELQQLFMMVY